MKNKSAQTKDFEVSFVCALLAWHEVLCTGGCWFLASGEDHAAMLFLLAMMLLPNRDRQALQRRTLRARRGVLRTRIRRAHLNRHDRRFRFRLGGHHLRRFDLGNDLLRRGLFRFRSRRRYVRHAAIETELDSQQRVERSGPQQLARGFGGHGLIDDDFLRDGLRRGRGGQDHLDLGLRHLDGHHRFVETHLIFHESRGNRGLHRKALEAVARRVIHRRTLQGFGHHRRDLGRFGLRRVDDGRQGAVVRANHDLRFAHGAVAVAVQVHLANVAFHHVLVIVPQAAHRRDALCPEAEHLPVPIDGLGEPPLVVSDRLAQDHLFGQGGKRVDDAVVVFGGLMGLRVRDGFVVRLDFHTRGLTTRALTCDAIQLAEPFVPLGDHGQPHVAGAHGATGHRSRGKDAVVPLVAQVRDLAQHHARAGLDPLLVGRRAGGGVLDRLGFVSILHLNPPDTREASLAAVGFCFTSDRLLHNVPHTGR